MYRLAGETLASGEILYREIKQWSKVPFSIEEEKLFPDMTK
jgi:hypothetical protein